MPYLTFKITVQINSLWINQIHFFPIFAFHPFLSRCIFSFTFLKKSNIHFYQTFFLHLSFFILRLLYLCSLTLSSYCFADLIKKNKIGFWVCGTQNRRKSATKAKIASNYLCMLEEIHFQSDCLWYSIRTGCNRMQNHFAVYWLIRFRIFYSVQKCIATKRNTSCWFFVSFEENFEEEKMRLFKLLNYFVAIMVVTKKRRSPMLRFYAFPMICCLFLIKLFSRQRCAPNLQCML